MIRLFDNPGSWYKGNLHMHTTRSDGQLSPEEAVALYRRAGYDFIALTDHWHQSGEAKADGLMILSGCEWDTGREEPLFHIIGVGMEWPVSLPPPARGPQEISDAIAAAGGLAILAHPAWSVTNPADCMSLRGLAGVEIYNSVSGLPWNGRRADSSIYIDIWAAQGKLFRCVAGDDSHGYRGEQTRAFIMAKARDLSAGSLKKALEEGDFYASQGPLFESVTFDGKGVEVRCRGARTVVFYSNAVWSDYRGASVVGGTAVYPVGPRDRYVRVELIDEDGKMAWTSPFAVGG